MIGENFPNLERDTFIQFQEALGHPIDKTRKDLSNAYYS
jgi:hypothetical protein